METKSDIIIIGGGLAGLTAGIHLSKKGLSVSIIEKSDYPRHKVCGEYISNEILPYLEWLGIDISKLEPVAIKNFKFTSFTGTPIHSVLPIGGFGISRYALDNFLYKKAIANGCRIIKEQVTGVLFSGDTFLVTTANKEFSATMVFGAYGKRSNIDLSLSRKFIRHKSSWLAVKAHYKGTFPEDMVALHNFKGGYCGVSKVESDTINICYLADYETFKKYKDIENYQKNVVCKNRQLKDIFENSSMIFEKPLTISQISFEKKTLIENHMIMIGDTAGLIHPLCGNGMAMAIHSAKIASELALDFHSEKITRADMEKEYQKEWMQNFGRRMMVGKLLGRVFQSPFISKQLFSIITLFPSLLDRIIKQTHGKPIQIN